jgi:hypothetical protein
MNNSTTERCFITSLEFPEHIKQQTMETKKQVTYRSARALACDLMDPGTIIEVAIRDL